MDPRKNYISFKVLRVYIKAHSYRRAGVALILIILNQLFRVISDYWLANWTDEDEKHLGGKNDNKNAADDILNRYIGTYVLLSIISVIISLLTNMYAQLITIGAVRKLHDKLLSTLVRCPMSFFDKSPTGHLVNLFTNDTNIMDKVILFSLKKLNINELSIEISEITNRYSRAVQIYFPMHIGHFGQHNCLAIFYHFHFTSTAFILLSAKNISLYIQTIATFRIIK